MDETKPGSCADARPDDIVPNIARTMLPGQMEMSWALTWKATDSSQTGLWIIHLSLEGRPLDLKPFVFRVTRDFRFDMSRTTVEGEGLWTSRAGEWMAFTISFFDI